MGWSLSNLFRGRGGEHGGGGQRGSPGCQPHSRHRMGCYTATVLHDEETCLRMQHTQWLLGEGAWAWPWALSCHTAHRPCVHQTNKQHTCVMNVSSVWKGVFTGASLKPSTPWRPQPAMAQAARGQLPSRPSRLRDRAGESYMMSCGRPPPAAGQAVSNRRARNSKVGSQHRLAAACCPLQGRCTPACLLPVGLKAQAYDNVRGETAQCQAD